jgi:DNA-binding response OmpR family regulator
MHLLVVEDDIHVAAALRTVLTRQGFTVSVANSAAEAFDAIAEGPNVVLLDLGLPDRDGFDVCGRIRQEYEVPVIMVTARTDVRSRIQGLDRGADDYLTKPYDIGELIARIHAVHRRAAAKQPRPAAPTQEERSSGTIEVRGVRIDASRRDVRVNGEPVALTRKEYDLLSLLAREPGVIFRREQIISEVWNTGWSGTKRTLEVHMASLRSKLGVPDLFETVRGVGYRLISDDELAAVTG